MNPQAAERASARSTECLRRFHNDESFKAATAKNASPGSLADLALTTAMPSDRRSRVKGGPNAPLMFIRRGAPDVGHQPSTFVMQSKPLGPDWLNSRGLLSWHTVHLWLVFFLFNGHPPRMTVVPTRSRIGLLGCIPMSSPKMLALSSPVPAVLFS
ncbi:hypothetical protein GSI_04621 [Ganoderma sinense ZZ0214-1]|uniref:Uncharacterized protein n=1 Tax=Ganoderma sinense ZZ0214-1 TaxID=1077348 RepID=A0A2G8SHE7_9APHY|nr:hypothetical protein GSI_04621 [Ganoderma sinense ZZ0214-1]